MCGSGNIGVGLFHCVATESVHTRVLYAAVATAVIAATFVYFAPKINQGRRWQIVGGSIHK